MAMTFKQKRKFIQKCEASSEKKVRILQGERRGIFELFLENFVLRGNFGYSPTKVKGNTSLAARRTKVGYY